VSLKSPVNSDHQLARLLQIGVVLEEVIEARAAKHADREAVDDEVRAFLRGAAAEAATHRERLVGLVEQLEADTIPFDDIKALVEQQYETGSDFDGILYDQLCNEETAYKFYDDLIEAVETADASFSIDRDDLLSVLYELRSQEEAGVEDVTELMETQQ
jgi:rubrerythrin